MNTKLPLAALSVAMLAGTAGVAMLGCQSSNRYAVSTADNAGLTLDASAKEILAGETVTIIARTVDTYGRDAKIEWSSTAGDLKTEQNGRIVRVRFEDIGAYTVRADLKVDGQVVATDIAEVRVRPIS